MSRIAAWRHLTGTWPQSSRKNVITLRDQANIAKCAAT